MFFFDGFFSFLSFLTSITSPFLLFQPAQFFPMFSGLYVLECESSPNFSSYSSSFFKLSLPFLINLSFSIFSQFFSPFFSSLNPSFCHPRPHLSFHPVFHPLYFPSLTPFIHLHSNCGFNFQDLNRLASKTKPSINYLQSFTNERRNLNTMKRI